MAKIKVADYLANVHRTAGFGYWMGTFGQRASKTLWDQKSRQYPDWYTRHANAYGLWIKGRVLDCVGIDKYARWLQPNGEPVYDPKTDLNQEMLFEKAKREGMKWGPISELPDVPGVAVYKSGHIGFYIGGGIVRESRGGDYGVVDRPVEAGPWTHYFYNPFVEYEVVTKTFTVTCSALNVRSGPSTDYDPVDTLKYGDVITVTDVVGTWGRHEKGWSSIKNIFCTEGIVKVNSLVPAPKPPQVDEYIVTCKELWVRTVPGISNNKLRLVKRGDTLRVTEEKNGWGKHQFGWSSLSDMYVRKVGSPKERPMLRAGDSGEAVKDMQAGLIAKGYSVGMWGPDGKFGPATQTAALSFLKDAGLVSKSTASMDNVTWGPRCWAALLD